MRDQLSSWTDGPSKNAIGRSPSRFYALPHIPRGCRSACSFGMTTAIASSRTMQVWRTSLEQGENPGWTVVSFKGDWATVFTPTAPGVA